MSISSKILLGALLAQSLWTLPARAGDYKLTVLEDGGAFQGCLAVNEDTNVGLLGIGEHMFVVATSKLFKVAKGEAVAGTWAIDGAKPIAFSDKASGANTVMVEITDPKGFNLVRKGNAFNVDLNDSSHAVEFDLSGSDEAVGDLSTCMKTKKAP